LSGTLIFWLAAAVLTLGLGGLVFVFAGLAAHRAEKAKGGEDPALAVYRRQLQELDELANRGLLPEAEQRAAKAEAGRRLISAADKQQKPEAVGGKTVRLAVAGAAAAIAVAAVGLYVALGSPAYPDLPYKTRLKAWSQSDLEFLQPPELAAVLREAIKRQPNNAEAYTYLARVELSAGDGDAALRAIQKARALNPDIEDMSALEGRAIVASNQGKVTPAAEAAFRKAIERNPGDPAARYYLGKAAIDAGRKEEGLAAWKALAAELPDDGKQQLEQEIAQVEKGQLAAQIAQADAPAQAQFIKAMVSRLAGKLKENPDDPDGWARLIRAYGVLGDTASQATALADMKRVYANRPAMALEIENSAKAPPQ
jgi:cytochrome c-type biogenesis protein CcmH